MIIPLPHDNEPEQRKIDDEYTSEQLEWIGEFWRIPDWQCTVCNSVMFGRVSYCIYCKLRLGKHTPKPIDLVDPNSLDSSH